MNLAARRWLAGLVTAAVAGLVTILVCRRYPTLAAAGYCTGWILLGVIVYLALYNARKKLAYPPLLSSAAWLRAHVYVGFLSLYLFLLHVGFRVPSGPFEVTLAGLFLGTAASGVIGLFLSRTIPPRLMARGAEVLFERIPALRREMSDRAKEVVLETAKETAEPMLSAFYSKHLAGFFSGPRNAFAHVCQAGRDRQRLLVALASERRYFNDHEKKGADELAELINAKDLLDYHYAMQGLLKTWLFVHIPLTYLMMLFAGVHAVVVHTFAGDGG